MPRASTVTPDLLAEIARRRDRGEAWKVIAADLRRRGLPHGRVTFWRWLRGGDVSKHPGACDAPSGCATP